MWEQLTTFIQSQLSNNDLFKGGLLLMAGGALLAMARSWPTKLWAVVKRQSMVVIDIPDNDQAFNWVNLWLAEHNYSKARARLLTVRTERSDRFYDKPKIIFSPAPGTHFMWYKWRLIILTRKRQDESQSSQTGPMKDPFRETFTIRVLGRKRDAALQLIDEAYTLANPNTVDKIATHRLASGYGNCWQIGNWVPKRHFSSVILPPMVAETLIKDIQTFFDSEEWYSKIGIPYRRGFLFYGPPGNGKTTAAIAIATHFNLDIARLTLKSSQMSDDDLTEALGDVPPNSIVLLEDIDCVTKGRELNSDITFSGLLNALDGVCAAHRQIVFMTTNHRDKLDDALIRPGRCDVEVEFTDPDDYQKEHMFDRFFTGSLLANHFPNQVRAGISMAALQKHLMKYRDDAEAAFAEAISIKRTSNDEETNQA